MRAVTVSEPGGPEVLGWGEVPDPVCGPGEVIVDVAATAVNRADLLQRQGVPLRGDLIFTATADEESGGNYGYGWLAEHAPDTIRATYAINEGGGMPLLSRSGLLCGLSLGEIAARLGVSKPTVWAWEHGKSRPVERRLAALADALGVTPSGLEPAPSGPNAELEQSRRKIAAAYGIEPSRVRIMIEL